MNRIVSVFKYIAEYIFYGNLFIALATFLLYQQTMLQVGGRWQVDTLSVIVFLGTIFVYDLARVIPVKLTREHLYHYRYAWLLKNFYPVIIKGIIAMIFCLILFFRIPQRDMITLIILAAVASLYNFPFFFKGKSVFRIRDISYLKSFLIALVWAGVTGLLPVIDSGIHLSIPAIIIITLERFFLILALMLPFDLRDVAEDKRFGLQTLAQKLGWYKAKQLSFWLIMLSYGLALFHDVLLNKHMIEWPAILLSALFAALVLDNMRENRSDYYFFGLVDGIIIFQAIAIWAVYQMA